MAKKKTPAKSSSGDSKKFAGAPPIDPRKKLLARVAGAVAANLVADPSPSLSTAEGIATVAVDIAEEILRKAGIPSASETADVPGAAAS